MNNKIKFLAILSASTYLASISSVASATGWVDGDCDSPPATVPCIEFMDGVNDDWHHIDKDHAPMTWHGPGPISFPGDDDTGVFVFEGETHLVCGFPAPSIDAECLLTLEGKVKVYSNGIGIMVTDGGVTQIPEKPDSTCDTILLSGTPWYIGPNSAHSFNSSSMVAYTGAQTYTGAIGTIGFQVGSLPVINGHMHDITFSNNGTDPNPSFFSFDSDVMTQLFGFDVSTGCHIEGNLAIVRGKDNSGNTYPIYDINIH